MTKTKELLVQVQAQGQQLAEIDAELPPGQALMQINACERKLADLVGKLVINKLAHDLGVEESDV